MKRTATEPDAAPTGQVQGATTAARRPRMGRVPCPLPEPDEPERGAPLDRERPSRGVEPDGRKARCEGADVRGNEALERQRLALFGHAARAGAPDAPPRRPFSGAGTRSSSTRRSWRHSAPTTLAEASAVRPAGVLKARKGIEEPNGDGHLWRGGRDSNLRPPAVSPRKRRDPEG